MYFVVAPSDALACFNSFTVTPEQRKSQIDALKSYFNLYAFADIAKNAAPPLFSSKVDIIATLDAIAANSSITTELLFHTKIKDAISSLNDAHANYRPSCFTQLVFVQPWVVAARYRQKSNISTSSGTSPGVKPELYLRELVTAKSNYFENIRDMPQTRGVESFWNGTLGDLAGYAGYTILKIDGEDPVVCSPFNHVYFFTQCMHVLFVS
jgi:hypothetical protein